MNIIDAILDDNVFKKAVPLETFGAWLVFLAALFGLPLVGDQLALYQQCTGRSAPPNTPAREGWLVVGRRGGKSFVLASHKLARANQAREFCFAPKATSHCTAAKCR